MWSLADNQGSDLTETTLEIWSVTSQSWITQLPLFDASVIQH